MRTKQTVILASFLVALSAMLSQAASAQEQKLIPNPQRPKRLGVHAKFVHLRHNSRPLFRTQIRTDRGRWGFDYGERIQWVERGSAAYRAGLERGDVIVATYIPGFNGDVRQPIRNRNSLRNAIRSARGNQLKLLVRNVRNGRYVKVTAYFDHHDGVRPLLRTNGR